MLQSGKPQVARLRSPRRPRIGDSRHHENRRFSNDVARLTIRGSLRSSLRCGPCFARDRSSDLPLSIPPVFAVFPAEIQRLAELATWAGMEGAERHRWRSRRLLGKLRFPVLDEDGRRKHFAGGVFASTASEGQRVAARAAKRAGPSSGTLESSGRGLPRHESSIPFTNHY